MTDSKLIDSSVWVEYLFNGKFTEIIDTEAILLLSTLSLFEIEKKLRKEKIDLLKINKSMDFIQQKSLLIPLSAEIAKKAVEVSLTDGLPAIDALIYATAVISHAQLVTADNDFRGLSDVIVVSQV